MADYGPIIQELEREIATTALLSRALNLRHVRVTRHPPVGEPVDLTNQYADGLSKASDALLKAVGFIKNVNARNAAPGNSLT